jgi:hypothetical protein
MGWRGTGGPTAGFAGVATYFFFGGLLMILGSIGEVSGFTLLDLYMQSTNMFAVYHRQYIPLRRFWKLRYVPLMDFIHVY